MIKLGVNYAKNVFVSTKIQIDLRSSDGLIFHGSGVISNGSNIITRRNGTIEFGQNFNVSSNFSCCSFERISIGSNLSCSWGVSICDTDFHETIAPDTASTNTKTQAIIIGNNCWLCQKCILLKGSKYSGMDDSRNVGDGKQGFLENATLYNAYGNSGESYIQEIATNRLGCNIPI